MQYAGNYIVVINDEEQYSVWPDFKDIPAGWHHVGFSGSKEQCLDHINVVWTDMRPLSLRKQLADPNPPSANVSFLPDSQPISLIDFLLGHSKHAVQLTALSKSELEKEILNDCVFIEIPNTLGGTVLGLPLTLEVKEQVLNTWSDCDNLCFSTVLNIDFEALNFEVDINLITLRGFATITSLK